jgi:hypothetical protein
LIILFAALIASVNYSLVKNWIKGRKKRKIHAS